MTVVETDGLGSLIARLDGASERPRIMLGAHMDELGFIVTHVDDEGFIRVVPLGGFDPKTKIAQRVIVHGREDLLGVMGAKPIHIMSDEERAILRIVANATEVGKMILSTPDTPADRIRALRRAFDATMKDPEFLAEAEKAKLDVSPMRGEEIGPLVAKVLATPPEIVARVKAALADGAKK